MVIFLKYKQNGSDAPFSVKLVEFGTCILSDTQVCVCVSSKTEQNAQSKAYFELNLGVWLNDQIHTKCVYTSPFSPITSEKIQFVYVRISIGQFFCVWYKQFYMASTVLINV